VLHRSTRRVWPSGCQFLRPGLSFRQGGWLQILRGANPVLGEEEIQAPIIWLWLTAFCAPASPVRSEELGSWSNRRSDSEPSRGSSGQPVACQSAGKNLSSKTARLGCLNYLPPSSSAVISTGLNCGIGDCGVDRHFNALSIMRAETGGPTSQTWTSEELGSWSNRRSDSEPSSSLKRLLIRLVSKPEKDFFECLSAKQSHVLRIANRFLVVDRKIEVASPENSQK
jgi:hypothetical protein